LARTSPSTWTVGIVGGAIAGVIAGIALDFYKVISLAAVWRRLVAVWQWSVSPVPVPLIVVAIVAGAAVVLTGLAIARLRAPRLLPWIASYVEDVFDGVIWQWAYRDREINERSIRAYCPRCSCGLMTIDYSSFHRKRIELECQACAFKASFDMSFSQLQTRIMMRIEHRLKQMEVERAHQTHESGYSR
jgi:hypothetical protein